MRRHKFCFSILNVRYNSSYLLLFIGSFQLALGRRLMFPRFDRKGHEPLIIVLLVKLLLLVVLFLGVDGFFAASRGDVVLIGLAQRLLVRVPRAISL